MSAPWSPVWEDFLVMSASATWVGESPVAEAWALSSQVFEGDPGVRLVVFGRLRVAEASHEIAARVGLASRHLSADEIALVGDAGRRREVARQANAWSSTGASALRCRPPLWSAWRWRAGGWHLIRGSTTDRSDSLDHTRSYCA
jgi:hypothetical protein